MFEQWHGDSASTGPPKRKHLSVRRTNTETNMLPKRKAGQKRPAFLPLFGKVLEKLVDDDFLDALFRFYPPSSTVSFMADPALLISPLAYTLFSVRSLTDAR